MNEKVLRKFAYPNDKKMVKKLKLSHTKTRNSYQ